MDADYQSSSNAVATNSGSSMSSTDAPSRNEPNTDTVPGVMVHTNRIRDVSAENQMRAKELNPPDAHAINCLLETARHTEYYELLHTAFYTGLRRGKVTAPRSPWGLILWLD